MLHKRQLDNILFIDIETVSAETNYENLSEEGQALWSKKFASLQRHDKSLEELNVADGYASRAAIYSEYGKIICISVGYLKFHETLTMRVKSFYGHDEKAILTSFVKMLDKHYDNPKNDFICGHNIKEFDIPYICRRILVHGLSFPKILDISAKKPWQVEHLIDTMQLWKFGDYKNFTSLRTLAYLFGIPSPKDDIDGSQVGEVYYKESGLHRIVDYCEKDTVTVARILLKWTGLEIEDMVLEKVT